MLDFDQNYRLRGTLQADQGQFVKDGSWTLDNTEQFDILQNGNATLVKQQQQPLALALQPKYVHMVTIDPEDLSPSQLVSFMSYMHEYSQVPENLSAGLLAKTRLAFCPDCTSSDRLLVIFGPLRQQSMGFRLVIALFAGLGFFYLQDFLGYASLIYAPSPAWFVFIPILIMFGIGGILAASGTLRHRKIEQINHHERLKPYTGHGLFL